MVNLKLQKAQSNLMVCVGICLGIEMFRRGEVDNDKSFFQNAIDCFADCGEELLSSMAVELQNEINAGHERAHNERVNGAPKLEDQPIKSEESEG